VAAGSFFVLAAPNRGWLTFAPCQDRRFPTPAVPPIPIVRSAALFVGAPIWMWSEPEYDDLVRLSPVSQRGLPRQPSPVLLQFERAGVDLFLHQQGIDTTTPGSDLVH
jgi:hypothetical protein